MRRYPWTRAEMVLVPLGILVLAAALFWSIAVGESFRLTNRYAECVQISWSSDPYAPDALPEDCVDLFD